MQAIRGLPLFCKDTPENIGKMVDILVQLLSSGKLWFTKILHSSDMVSILIFFFDLIFLDEFVERDAVHKALMSLLRQDVKGN